LKKKVGKPYAKMAQRKETALQMERTEEREKMINTHERFTKLGLPCKVCWYPSVVRLRRAWEKHNSYP